MLETELGIQLDAAAKECLNRNYVYNQTMGHIFHTVLKHFQDQLIYKKRKVPKTPEEREALRKEDEIFTLQRKMNPQLPVHGPQNTLIWEWIYDLKDYSIKFTRVFQDFRTPSENRFTLTDWHCKFLAYKVEEFIHDSEEATK